MQIEILFCGICHSDLHMVRNEWSDVHAHRLPDRPGPRDRRPRDEGRLGGHASTRRAISSASAAWSTPTGTCPECKAGLEQFCPNVTLTYNSPDKHLGGVTYGGYSESIVVDEHFVLRVPANLDPAGARAAALRRHHDLLAAAPLGRRPRARRSASSGWAGSATWA